MADVERLTLTEVANGLARASTTVLLAAIAMDPTAAVSAGERAAWVAELRTVQPFIAEAERRVRRAATAADQYARAVERHP